MASEVWGRRFTLLLAAIVLAGAVLRIGYVVAVTRHDRAFYDAVYYEQEARNIADGKGWFHQPLLEIRNPPVVVQSAEHPPLTELLLVPAASIPGAANADVAMRLTMVALGTVTVLLIGLVGRSLGGPVVGLVAAAIAALDPNLWMNDGILMSETVATLGTAAVIYLALRGWQGRVSWRWAAVMGAVAGLATLARSELSLLVPLLVLPAVLAGFGHREDDRADRPRHAARRAGARWQRWRRGLAPAVLAAGAFAAVLAPWVVFNLSRFDEPAPLSTAVGEAMLSANCAPTYHGPLLGSSGLDLFSDACAPFGDGSEISVRDAHLRHLALSFIAHHPRRYPLVVAARFGRVLYLFRPSQTIHLASPEGRPVWAEWLGAVTTWLILPLAVGGAVVARRRRAPLWPVAAPIVAVAATFLLISGVPRYRATAEPSLVILAGFAVVAIAGVLAGRRPERANSRQ